ncbi:MAG: hypothetical protein ACE5PV_21085, partial [Candidatus Poribacteria bacterium]
MFLRNLNLESLPGCEAGVCGLGNRKVVERNLDTEEIMTREKWSSLKKRSFDTAGRGKPMRALRILSRFILTFAAALILLTFGRDVLSQESEEAPRSGAKLAFVGLHGGVFEQLKKFEKELDVELEYIFDEQIKKEEVDFASYDIIFLQHIRGEDRDQYKRLVASAKKRNPKLRIFDISKSAEQRLPSLVKSGLIEHDPQIRKYYG